MHLLQKFDAQRVSIDLREPLFYFDSTEDFSDKGNPVYRIIFDIQKTNLSYKVGDALGVFPQNPSQIVEDVLDFLRYSPDEHVNYCRVPETLSIKNFLTNYADLDKLPKKLLIFFPKEVDPEVTLYDALKEYRPSIPVEFFVNSVFPLLPRLYSIASSPYVSPNKIELLVRRISYQGKFQRRYGVCSTFLCESLVPKKDSLFVYVQPTKHFTLSEENQNRPIVMIGSGTGIAPFKGFMEQRLFQKCLHKNFLFFGERQRAVNFYYQEFWRHAVAQKALHIFSVFSREGYQKFYVQDALREQKDLIKNIYEEEACFFVCGRKILGSEVKKALEDILGENSVSSLRKERRYVTDVY
ncbi:sulfite reductase flavoprotein subunit alpha [Chlamydia sp. 17-3921]|uniref:sulfite reductase flavoprotein subunit alpha n=1 Tax=Chlamydia sp. 17-3921 TaxID=2675798 RepID=UPI0019197D67|nr:sulfite reductase flavoprotein subunit alpha [Chlamydia sp. 17-3921]